MRRSLVTRTVRYAAVGTLALAATVAVPTQPAAAEPSPGDAAAQPLVPILGSLSGPPPARPLYSPGMEARFNTQIGLMPTARALAQQATGSASDIGGVRVDLDAGTVHVYRTETGRALNVPAALPGASKVVVHPARFTRNAMTATMQGMIKDTDLLLARKVTVDSMGPNVDGSGLTVSVFVAAATAEADVRAATKELRARYGGIIAKVVGTQHVPSDDDYYFDGRRFNDAAPWSGGDRILAPYGGCTTGFAAMQGEQPVMLTAAHCGPVGGAFYNGPNSSGGYSFMGYSIQSNGDTDIGAIAVEDSFPFVNAGPAQDPFQLLVWEWGAPIVGSTVCMSGSYSGEICQLEVVTSGVRTCLRRNIFGSCRRWSGNFADAINRAGPEFPGAGHGDSGAPIYEFSVPSAGVGNGVGMVSRPMTGLGYSMYPDYFPTNLLCDSPEGPSYRCSAGFSFAHMPNY